MEQPIVKSITPNKFRLIIITGAIFLTLPVLLFGDIYAKVIFGILACSIMLLLIVSPDRYFYETYLIEKSLFQNSKKILFSDIQKFKVVQGKKEYTPLTKFILYSDSGKHRFALNCLEAEKLIEIFEKNNISKCD